MTNPDAYFDALEHTLHRKVYCEDCDSFSPAGRPGYVEPRCLHPHALVVEETPIRRQYSRVSPCDKNAQNDCPDFVTRDTSLRGEWRRRRQDVFPVCVDRLIALAVSAAVGCVLLAGCYWLLRLL
jgi:hypothetical protein